ncbi:MAG: hypothetical protein MJZ87_03020 [Bacteroidales bacterium]|nr:hypothetical protein [Bacteroidales bacterium]
MTTDDNMNLAIRNILGLCKTINKYSHRLTLEDLMQDPRSSEIPDLGLETVERVREEVSARIARGCQPYENKVIMHTGPHHDDIMLGIMPLINRQLRPVSNEVYFSIMTSGFHSVTDGFMEEALRDTLSLLDAGKIEMVKYPDFFKGGFLLKRDKDVHHYLDNVAKKDSAGMRRGFCHRLVRDMVSIWSIDGESMLRETLCSMLDLLSIEKHEESEQLNQLKGLVREFEEELVWAYMGVPVRNVRHLHLGLYGRDDDEFAPDIRTDVLPVLEQFRQIRPEVISVVMDAGDIRPDTHFKVLLSVASALKLWNEETDLSQVRILAYRNVWSTFHPSEANMYVPVSLNAFAVIEKAFASSYMTQYKAEFPNPSFDGPFSELAESIWVKQLRDIQFLLGKDFFYQNKSALIRATHGMLFLNDYSVEEFLNIIKERYSLKKGN